MKFNVKRYFRVLGISLLVVLIASVVCMGIDFTSLMNKGNGESDHSSAIVDAKGDKINALIMCTDIDGLRTDAMMLVQYDGESNAIKLLSIPRDTRLYVGNRYQKINAAHAFVGENGEIGGPEAACEAVSRITGVPINFTIPDIHGDGEGMVYDDPIQGLHINLPPGNYDLNGSQVVQMLRYRKNNYGKGYINGDRDRIALQQEFLKTFVDQKLNASLILKIPAIFKDVLSEIKTNVTVADVIKYSKYLSGITSANMTTLQLPGTDANDSQNGAVWVPNLEKIREIIQTEFGYDAMEITVENPYGKPGDHDYGTYNENLVYEDGGYDAEFDVQYDQYDG